MSSIETQHGAYLGSEVAPGEYEAERRPLLRSDFRRRSSEGQFERYSGAENDESRDLSEQMPTFHLLLTQFNIILQSSLPVFGTHLLEYALLITSVLAVGHLGKLELAACTIGSMTANVTAFSIIIGMAGALDTVLPGIWGASAHPGPSRSRGRPKSRDSDKIADSRLLGLWCQRMAILYLMLLVPIISLWLNAERILLLLRQDKEVARLAERYLKMLVYGLPAFAFNTIAKRYFQAQGLFSVPTKIGTVVAGVNVLLTGLLVYYPSPLPRALAPYLHLGFDGASLSTAISYNLVAIGSAIWAWKIESQRRGLREALENENDVQACHSATPTLNEDSTAPNTAVSSAEASPAKIQAPKHSAAPMPEIRSAWHPLSSRALHPTGLSTLLTLGLGGVGQTASEWWAWELVGLASSLLGPTALASQSVLLVSCSTSYQVPFALGVATSVRIGQLLGLGRPRSAKLAAHAAILLGLGLSLIFSSIFWIYRKKWGYLFNNDEDVATMVASILPLVALFQVFDGNAGITGGILRARGKQGTGALLNLSAYYVLGVPLGVYLAFKDIGLPSSLPEHPVVNSLGSRLATLISPSKAFSSMSSILQSGFVESAAASSQFTASAVDNPIYPSLPEATAGLRGLWIGLTVSLIYCAVFGTALCLRTDWDHEVEKVRARMREEERRSQRELGGSSSATYVDGL